MARPLNKTKTDGARYTRLPEIEAAIDAALGQDLEIVCDRARLRDRKAENYLPSECLVHLIREAWRSGNEQARDELLQLLLDRCAAILNSKVSDSICTAEQLREDILGDFAELFAKDGSSQEESELDFYEVRFNLAFSTFRITRVRDELDRLNSTRDLPDPDRPDVRVDDEILARLSDRDRSRCDPEELVLRKQVHDAINALPRDERKAIVLCYLLGLKEESEDPNERTAATVCGVTGRTIRNRMTSALAKLSRLKEET
jgi:DNA-directed RNA polymerase specialized sigma24 family protein